MLRKLMKHELAATGRVMLPMFLLVLLAAVGGNISTYRLLETDSNVLSVIGLILLTLFIVAIFAACLLSFVLMVQRFYKNLLRDEGYLMMTLPASVHEHVISKMVVSVLWFAATALVLVLAFFILVYDIGLASELFEEIRKILGSVNDAGIMLHGASFGLELVAVLALWDMGVCLQFYAALAVGHSFASHKMLFSIAAYFAMQIALQIIGVLFANLMVALNLNELINQALQSASQATTIHLSMFFLMGAALVFGAVHYAITTYFLKNKLNLS